MTNFNESIANFANFTDAINKINTELSRYGTFVKQYADASYTYLVYSYQFSNNLYGTAILSVRLQSQSGFINIAIALAEAFNTANNAYTNLSTYSSNMRLNYNEQLTTLAYANYEVFGVTFASLTSAYIANILIFRMANCDYFDETNLSMLLYPQAASSNVCYGLPGKTFYGFTSFNSNNCYVLNSNSYGTNNYINPYTNKITIENRWMLRGNNGANNQTTDNIFDSLYIGTNSNIGTKINDGINPYVCIYKNNTGVNSCWLKLD